MIPSKRIICTPREAVYKHLCDVMWECDVLSILLLVYSSYGDTV